MTSLEALRAGLWALVIAFGLMLLWEIGKMVVREVRGRDR